MNEQDEKLSTADIVPVDRTALARFGETWKDHLNSARDVPCSSPEEAEWWTAWRNAAHDALQAHDGERKEASGPYYNDFTVINKWFGTSGLPATELKNLANEKLAAFALEQEAASKAAAARAQLAAEAGDEDAVYEALAAIPDVQRTEGNSLRMGWTIEVVDEAAVNRAFTSFDEKKFRKAYPGLDKMDVAPEAPGLKFTRTARAQPTGRRK